MQGALAKLAKSRADMDKLRAEEHATFTASKAELEKAAPAGAGTEGTRGFVGHKAAVYPWVSRVLIAQAVSVGCGTECIRGAPRAWRLWTSTGRRSSKTCRRLFSWR